MNTLTRRSLIVAAGVAALSVPAAVLSSHKNTHIPGRKRTPTPTPTATTANTTATTTATGFPTVLPPPATVTPEPTVWLDHGVVLEIASSPTALARIICQLHPFNGRLFLGYGDWNDIVQPGCHLIALGPDGYETYGHFTTDAFWSLRTVNGELWALITDPEVGADPDAVIVAADGSVRVLQGGLTPYPFHLFDAVRFLGKTYVAGSVRKDDNTDDDTVWRDDGDRWRISRQGTGQRCYALFVLGSTMYVTTSFGQTYKTTDGASWTYASGAPTVATKAMVRGAEAIYRQEWPAVGSGQLYAANGVTQSALGTVRDHFVDGPDLWTLNGRTVAKNGIAVYTDAPTTAVSLAFTAGRVYVGTSDSKVYSR